MAPSQLKQLKTSLRDNGVLGPQQSKKVRKANAKDGQKRLQRNAALQGIREKFNPFEVKAPARKDKFEVATNRPTKSAIGRPGVTRGLGEERRRDTLLREMQSRNKVGGMLDRRFGENDPTMTPEERAAERFARQALRTSKKNSMFNLEDDSDEEMVLTHGGRSLELDDLPKDDFQEDDLNGLAQDDLDDRPTKRLRFDNDTESAAKDDEEEPERKKTKNEVMKEIIAKSKMYKAERQAAKADDDDLRAELDKGMGDFYEALRTHVKPQKQLPSPPHTDSEPTMDPGRAAMLAGKSREDAEKEYEANLRQLKLEARSKPSTRTKTEEEKATEQAAKLEELERNRLRRMRGESESSEDEDNVVDHDEVEDDEEDQDDAGAFGLLQPQYAPRPQLDVEEEDQFVLDDIIASDSDADLTTDDEDQDSEEEVEPEDDGDDDFINGLVLPKAIEIKTKPDTSMKPSPTLAYTFPCPQTHEEMLKITESTKLEDLPTIVQRIRALYHKGIAPENQEKLGKFVKVLVEHVSYLANGEAAHLSYSVLESLLRHLHSMAKTQPDEVGLAFRDHLREIAEDRPLALNAGDMLLLMAVSTIFPTSDHFHAITTPAMLTISRYLGQTSIETAGDLSAGAYACSLALNYQRYAQRYVPEVVTYLVNAVAILAPSPLAQKSRSGQPLNIAIRLPEADLRISQAPAKTTPKLSFDMLRQATYRSEDKLALLKAFLFLIERAAQLWQSKSAFPELVLPLQEALSHLLSPSCKKALPNDIWNLAKRVFETLSSLVETATTLRKPLLLHNHRPLAIKSSIPQFIENFNPDRHYDPDRERAEIAKLKAEHKKERKGAMRELRKDAHFIAREQLREKKARDAAYEKKFNRLIAEIQGEEGREAKEYEREKARRKK